MKHFPLPIVPAMVLVLTVPVAAAAATARAAAEVQTLNADALAAMENGKWEEALALLDRCIADHGQDALARFGPSFGVTWYRKGMCEMRLRRWEAAVTSFETCYSGFPNKNGDRENLFNKRALLRWGEASQAVGKPAEAVRLLRKFLAERDKKKDTFEPGSYYVQLALGHFQLGEITEGAENFETAVRNKAGFGSPEAGLVAVLQAFVDASIAKKDEASLVAFLARNRGSLTLEPYRMEPYAAALVRLGTEAMGAGMDAAALALFDFVPATGKMVEDLRARIAAADGPPDKAPLEASLARLEALRREDGTHDAVQWSATAAIHERQGDPKASFAAYEQLEIHFPKGPRREENLSNLVRLAALAGEAAAAEKYGKRFLETFPGSARVPALRRSMLAVLFDRGDYASCIAASAELLPKLADGSPEHDMCLHFLGGSHHHTGDFAAAQPLLDRHASLYPGSPFRRESIYLQAANLARLGRGSEAAPLLDKIAAEPGPFLAAALLERARCHAAAGETAAAVEKLERLEKECPDSEVLASALLFQGDLALKEGRGDDGRASYEAALALAGKNGNRGVAGEALYRLIATLGAPSVEKPRLKEALPFIDRFWKDHGDDSPWRDRVAVAQAAALDAAGREKEALDRLRAVITGPDPAGMPEAVGAYAAVYSHRHGAAALKDHIREFPGLPPDHKPARAWLHMAAISAFEDSLAKAKDEAAKSAAEGEIKALFQDVKSSFTPGDLPSAVLIRTGDHLAAKTSAPRQALPYYDEALARKDPSARIPALLGRATVLTVGSKEETAAALRDLQAVFTDSPDPKEREDALFWIVVTAIKTGDFEAAGAAANRYLAPDTGFTRYVPEVRLALARSFQERGMTGEAVQAFKGLWSDPACPFTVAASAMNAWLPLSWDRPVTSPDDKTDRATICGEGTGFLERTRPLFDSMNSSDQETWLAIETLTKDYQSSLGTAPPAGP